MLITYVRKMINKIVQFVKEAKVELKKVNWPTRKELIDSTKVVLITSFLLAFFIFIVDFMLSHLIDTLLG
ncbi:MAG: preprotein translocase subunit SecE [Candidatus Auribacterota bacterium]|nr:preprotein translocase subunit SecE [Candidatus Auribacterota bacterium]